MNAPSILAVRFSSLGDAVITTAVYPNIKAHWPGARITVLTKPAFAAVFRACPSVDEVWTYDPRTERFADLLARVRAGGFDWALDLHASLRSRWLLWRAGVPNRSTVRRRDMARRALVWFKRGGVGGTVRERALETLGAMDVPVVHPETFLTAPGADDVLRRFQVDPAWRLIGIAPGAQHATKRWPAERYAEAADRLAALPNALVILLGDAKDAPVVAKVASLMKSSSVNLAGRTTLAELIAVTSKLSFLLTNDSGIMHIAEAFKVPLTALFGPTVRGFGFAPYRRTSRVVEVTGMMCRPCSLHGGPVCPLRHHNCMNDIETSAVMFAASSAMNEASLEDAGGPECRH